MLTFVTSIRLFKQSGNNCNGNGHLATLTMILRKFFELNIIPILIPRTAYRHGKPNSTSNYVVFWSYTSSLTVCRTTYQALRPGGPRNTDSYRLVWYICPGSRCGPTTIIVEQILRPGVPARPGKSKCSEKCSILFTSAPSRFNNSFLWHNVATFLELFSTASSPGIWCQVNSGSSHQWRHLIIDLLVHLASGR